MNKHGENWPVTNFDKEKIISMIEDQMAEGTDFNELVCDFKYGCNDCLVQIKHIKSVGKFEVNVGVVCSDPAYMTTMSCTRSRDLETILDFFKGEGCERIIMGYVDLIID
ncbi:hypothetical protein GPL15_08645 [Clostridium sp. MCC353]|uniref:hypothetical protein n=1 Tax=Clostridium sp. MCC353 TaxID=2592646 RepID=UPI001C0102FA|nr:hypothetical protein [Clostridium sp. MCC353]MBT9776571.1 hypothetical protein [Clostridium sp. MCC353]